MPGLVPGTRPSTSLLGGGQVWLSEMPGTSPDMTRKVAGLRRPHSQPEIMRNFKSWHQVLLRWHKADEYAVLLYEFIA